MVPTLPYITHIDIVIYIVACRYNFPQLMVESFQILNIPWPGKWPLLHIL